MGSPRVLISIISKKILIEDQSHSYLQIFTMDKNNPGRWFLGFNFGASSIALALGHNLDCIVRGILDVNRAGAVPVGL